MSTTLDENLNVISENENMEIELLDGDLNIIQKLDDEPNDVGGMTAAQLKAEFDKAGNIIKTYLNETLVPKIIEEDATNAARAEAEAAREAAESAREAAESARAAEELERESAETVRREMETARKEAESNRQTAEAARQEAESDRVGQELVRRQAETARKAAETARAAAETERENKETGYVAQAEAAAKAAQEAITKIPTIIEGTWWVYDPGMAAYVDTGVKAQGDGIEALVSERWVFELSDGTIVEREVLSK